MNGAESLVRTLVGGGVDVCFANPGTSEMHFVSALDRVPGMRCVLGLFEGVCSGAADGYGRMTGRPAATLLHLGPGLANASANLHNAKRAGSPILNIVGDHATYHRAYDAPLTSDIEGAARPYSHWVKTSPDSQRIASDAAEAIAASLVPPGQIATLILPADTAWNEAAGPAKVAAAPSRAKAGQSAVDETARLLRANKATAILLDGLGLRADALALAGQIAAATGAKLFVPNSVSRLERGAGRVPVDAVPYPIDQAMATLAPYETLILVGANAPVAFFAYPGKPSITTPEGCTIHTLARPNEDILHALAWLADELGASKHAPTLAALDLPALATGKVTAASVGQSLAALIPEGGIIVDESQTSGRTLRANTLGSRPHDWMKNLGGSIGFALPVATGAAIACPDRRVICLESDGSGMYTLQSLWTQAREKLDVTTILFSNRAYAILKGELKNVQASDSGRNATDMLTLDRPDMDWTMLARGMGVEAERPADMEQFNRALTMALGRKGPYLIEVML